MRKEILTMNSEKVVKFYNSRLEALKRVSFTDLSLISNQLALIKDMLEGAVGKEKKEIRINYLNECINYFDKIPGCEFTSTLKFNGCVDIVDVLRKKRIFKKDLENLYLLVRVYLLVIAKYKTNVLIK